MQFSLEHQISSPNLENSCLLALPPRHSRFDHLLGNADLSPHKNLSFDCVGEGFFGRLKTGVDFTAFAARVAIPIPILIPFVPLASFLEPEGIHRQSSTMARSQF